MEGLVSFCQTLTVKLWLNAILYALDAITHGEKRNSVFQSVWVRLYGKKEEMLETISANKSGKSGR